MQKLLLKKFFLLFICMCFLNCVTAQSSQQCFCKNNGSCVSSQVSTGNNVYKLCQCKQNFLGGKCQYNGIQLKDQKQISSTLNNQQYKYFYISLEQQNIYAFFFHLCFDKSQISSQEQGIQSQIQNNSISFFFQIQEINGYLDTNQNATHPSTIQFQNNQACKNIFIHYTPLAKTMLGKLQKLIFAVKYGKMIKSSQQNNRLLSQNRQLNFKDNKLNIRILQDQKEVNDLKIEIDYEKLNKQQERTGQKQDQAETFLFKDGKKQQSFDKIEDQSETLRKFKTQRTFTEQEQHKNQNKILQNFQQNQVQINKNKNDDINYQKSKIQQQQNINQEQKQQLKSIDDDKNSLNFDEIPDNSINKETRTFIIQQKQKLEQKLQKSIIDQEDVSPVIIEAQTMAIQNVNVNFQQKQKQKQDANSNININIQTKQSSSVQQEKEKQQQQITITKIEKSSQKSITSLGQKEQLNLPYIQSQSQSQSMKVEKKQKQEKQKTLLEDKLESNKKRIQKKVMITVMVYPFFDEDLIFNLLFSFTSIAGLLVLGAMGYIIRNRIIGIRHSMRIAAREKNNLSHFEEMIPPQRYEDFKQKQITQQQCSICLTNLVDNDSIRYTPCQHIFHTNCLDSWCQQNLSCPMCRRSLRKPNNISILLSGSQIQMNPTQENI